jgi:enterochelin esterase family protein
MAAASMSAAPPPTSPASPLAAVNWSSRAAVQRFLAAHRFPWVKDGWWVFIFNDESGSARSVKLRHGLAGHRSPPSFHDIGEGLFVRDLHAPMVDRLEYRFEIVDKDRKVHAITDPLNDAFVDGPFDRKSVAFAPGYRPPPWASTPPDQAVGALTTIKVPGPTGRPRQAWLWEPPNTPPHETLPVIVFLDGADHLNFAGTRQTLENLVHFDVVPRCRAYFLRPVRRNDEYSANTMTALALGESIPEALAAIRPMPRDPALRLGVGQSLGGLCLLHTHWTRPGFFGGMLLQSGSFFQPHSDSVEKSFVHFGRITEFVHRVHKEPFARSVIPFHLTCGRGEENLANNRAMAATLHQHGFPVTFVETADAHNWTAWRDSLGAGLAKLLPGPMNHRNTEAQRRR